MAKLPNSCENGTKEGIRNESFIEVDENLVTPLLEVLKARLPYSCVTYNQLKVYDLIKDDLSIYVFEEKNGNTIEINSDDSSGLWILLKFIREDWGTCITISPPSVSVDAIVPACVERALETSNYIDWSAPFVLICIDQFISDVLVKLNVRKFGNVIKIFPSYLFYMKPEDALKLELSCDPSIKIGPLDPNLHEDFLTKRWGYTKEGTDAFVRKCIERLPFGTGGVFLPNGELASAAITPGVGVLSCLLTDENHRRKGYASLVIKYIFKEVAKHGLQPCLDAEITEHGAVAFHKSINPNIISKVDYVSHKAM